jgi:hypothetical protein
MRVKDEYEYMDVYGIYWIDNVTYFLCLSKNNFGPYRATEVTIVDPYLSGEFTFFDGNSIFYKPLIEEKLLEDLYEQDQEAFERFLEILKKDGNGEKYKSYLELERIPKWWTI